MRVGILLRAFLTALTLAGGAAQAGVNSWTMTGPDGGYTMSVAIHPTNPDVMLAQTYGGLYRTTDAGAHWSFVVGGSATGTPGANGSIVFDPTDAGANRVFIASLGVFRSDDGGRTFTAVTNPTTRSIEEIAVASDGTLYVGDHGARVFRSGDRGQTWTEVPAAWPVPTDFGLSELVVDPNDPNRLYVGTTRFGMYRSDDRGATWVAPAPGSPGLGTFGGSMVTTIAVQPGNSNRLLAATGGNAYYLSTDRGANWTQFFDFFRAITWVGFDPVTPGNAVALDSQGSLLRSTDAGDTWPAALISTIQKPLYVSRAAFAPGRGGRLLIASSDGPFLSDNGGATFSLRVTGIHAGKVSDFAASDDGTLYAAFEFGPFGIYRRETSGWMPLNNAALRGVVNTAQLGELATSAIDSNLIYAVNQYSEVLRSRDGGVSWSSIAGAYTVNGHPQDVAIDPSNPDTVYIGTYSEGLWRTVNGGATWQRLAGGLPQRIDVIAIDPANTQTLYVLTTDEPNAVYKSTDGGLNWTPVGNLPRGTRQGITFDPEDTRTLYIYSGGDVVKSTDGGATGTQINFGPPGNTYVRAMAVLVDPGAHNTIWVVSHPYTPGFSRSVDGGLTWERVTLNVPVGEYHALDEAVLDPLRPNVLHVGVTAIGIVEYEVAPDLAISLDVPSNPLAADSTVNGSVTIRNLGPHASSAAELRITLPSWVTVDVPHSCRLNPGLLVCELSPLTVDSLIRLPLALTVAQTPGSGQIVATIAGHERDPVATNDRATRDVNSTMQSAMELTLETASPNTGLGESMTFLARLANPGPSRARDVRLELQLGSLSGEEVVALPNACTRNAATVSCNFGTLEAASSVTVSVRALAPTLGATTITGTATRAGTDPEATDTASRNVNVMPVADFSVETVDSPDPVVSGGVITYTSTIRNNGPDASKSTYTLLTAGTTINAPAVTGGICGVSGTSTLICTLDSLASGATITIQITGTAGAVGTATFSSTSLADGIDRVASNNQHASSTAITSPPTPPRRSGGGGGRFDWLFGALLGALLVRRAAAHQQRRQHSHA